MGIQQQRREAKHRAELKAEEAERERPKEYEWCKGVDYLHIGGHRAELTSTGKCRSCTAEIAAFIRRARAGK